VSVHGEFQVDSSLSSSDTAPPN